MSYSGGWDWKGILTHFTLETVGSMTMAALLLYGRYHVKHKTNLLHKLAHKVRWQFGVEVVFDFIVAVITIQLLHL